ncbi:MAG TPA: HupE/UreJ family protein [Gaiellaceae bacterium]|jgi:high-affinity nickel permease
MFGLDDFIASYSDGAAVWLVVLVAVLLGLRHATDPDHLAAVSTLVVGTRERATTAATKLGAAWGLGHALTLFAFGIPILLLDKYLPERAQQAAETAIAFVIAYLAVRLVLRWRQGVYRLQAQHSHPHRGRTGLSAFGIGLVHGMGGSAGVGVLLVASIESQSLGVVALGLLAIFTAVSMTLLSAGFGFALGTRPMRASFNAAAPVFGLASLAFACWYGAAAWALAPYPF